MTRSKEDIKKYQKEYRDKHKAQRKNYDKSRYHDNISSFQEKNADYYANNQQIILERSNQYYFDHKDDVKDKHRTYIKFKRKTDINFNLKSKISKYVNIYLKSNNSSKKDLSILKYLPYTIEELKQYIEYQFEPWMTWGNWGRYDKNIWNDNDQSTWTWQIDHIIPHSTFKYISMEDEEFKKCWALENLRPYSAKQNLLDGARE